MFALLKQQVQSGVYKMVEAVKEKTGRAVTRLFGQSLDAQGAVVGTPIEVRFAFPYVHEKRTKSAGGAELDKPRNDVVVMVPKLAVGGDCPNWKLLCAFLMEAAVDAWKSWPVGYSPKIQDGDIPHRPKPKPGLVPLTEDQIIARNAWRRGCWIVEVSTPPNNSPKVAVMQNGVATEIPAKVVLGQELYKSGDYGYVSMNAYTFNTSGNFGVNYGFEGLLFSRPGELIGQSSGPRPVAQMFGSVAGMVSPTAPVMPGAGVPQMPQPQYAPPAPAPAYAPPAAPVYAPPAPPAPVAPPLAPTAPTAPGMAPLPPFPAPVR
jgi:hypothetical protein